jgi:ApeA N-terminal domain 1
MAVLEQRGVFWWHDEEIPEGKLAPDSNVAGLLRIEDDGRAALELDSYLSNPNGPFAAMTREPVTRCIQGLLKGTSDRALLCDPIRDGGRFSSNGISFESFKASHCLLYSTEFVRSPAAPEFSAITIPLKGYEEWLRLGEIKVEQSAETITATCKVAEDITYPSGRDTLSMTFDAQQDAAGALARHAYSLKLTACATLSFGQPSTLTDLGLQFTLFEDLLKLLSPQNTSLIGRRCPSRTDRPVAGIFFG